MSKLIFYTQFAEPPQIVPANHKRNWMDNTIDAYAYRCLPLNIANAFGWDVLCPIGFSATWDGVLKTMDPKKNIVFTPDQPGQSLEHLVTSHFAAGVFTFHLGFIVRTEAGWDTLVTGPANNPKHGVIPLSGMVETDWLPFTFTLPSS